MNIDKMVNDELIKIESDTEPASKADVERLKGDTFNPLVNTDIDPSLLAWEEKGFENLAYEEGLYFYTSYYKCFHCKEWLRADNINMFVGDTNKGSGYDNDILYNAGQAYINSLPLISHLLAKFKYR